MLLLLLMVLLLMLPARPGVGSSVSAGIGTVVRCRRRSGSLRC